MYQSHSTDGSPAAEERRHRPMPWAALAPPAPAPRILRYAAEAFAFSLSPRLLLWEAWVLWNLMDTVGEAIAAYLQQLQPAAPHPRHSQARPHAGWHLAACDVFPNAVPAQALQLSDTASCTLVLPDIHLCPSKASQATCFCSAGARAVRQQLESGSNSTNRLQLLPEFAVPASNSRRPVTHMATPPTPTLFWLHHGAHRAGAVHTPPLHLFWQNTKGLSCRADNWSNRLQVGSASTAAAASASSPSAAGRRHIVSRWPKGLSQAGPGPQVLNW
jgi:hypothetical protein